MPPRPPLKNKSLDERKAFFRERATARRETLTAERQALSEESAALDAALETAGAALKTSETPETHARYTAAELRRRDRLPEIDAAIADLDRRIAETDPACGREIRACAVGWYSATPERHAETIRSLAAARVAELVFRATLLAENQEAAGLVEVLPSEQVEASIAEAVETHPTTVSVREHLLHDAQIAALEIACGTERDRRVQELDADIARRRAAPIPGVAASAIPRLWQGEDLAGMMTDEGRQGWADRQGEVAELETQRSAWLATWDGMSLEARAESIGLPVPERASTPRPDHIEGWGQLLGVPHVEPPVPPHRQTEHREARWAALVARADTGAREIVGEPPQSPTAHEYQTSTYRVWEARRAREYRRIIAEGIAAGILPPPPPPAPAVREVTTTVAHVYGASTPYSI